MTDPKTPPDALTADEERARAALVDDLGEIMHALLGGKAARFVGIGPDPARVRTILAGPLGIVAWSTVNRLDDLCARQRAEDAEVKL